MSSIGDLDCLGEDWPCSGPAREEDAGAAAAPYEYVRRTPPLPPWWWSSSSLSSLLQPCAPCVRMEGLELEE